MKKHVGKGGLLFVAKSLLWSVLLYAMLMVVINWDDVGSVFGAGRPITLINGNRLIPVAFDSLNLDQGIQSLDKRAKGIHVIVTFFKALGAATVGR